MRWARLYQRKFDDAGGGMRVPVSPIAGSRNVLFAPANSRWLMLVDRATGALVRRRTDLSWTSIGGCGPEHVLVTTPSSVQRLSLAGLESGKVVDKARMLHVAALADGCVLSGIGELAIMDSQDRIVRSTPLPPDVVPVCTDARDTGGGGAAWPVTLGDGWTIPRRADSFTCPRPPPARDRTRRRIAASIRRSLAASRGRRFRMRQNFLTRLGADGRPRWEFPLPPDAAVLEGGRRVIANFRRRVWTFDDADGSVCSVWPPLTGATNTDISPFRIATRESSSTRPRRFPTWAARRASGIWASTGGSRPCPWSTYRSGPAGSPTFGSPRSPRRRSW